LTGQPPFPDTNLLSQMIRHATEPARPLNELNPAVPDGLQQIVNWMLAKDPAQRYPTPERAAQALQVFLTAGGEPARSSEEGPNLRKYLTWLEMNKDDDKDRLPAAPQPALAAVGRPAAPAEAPRAGRRHGSKKHKRHKHSLKAAFSATGAEAPTRSEEFDVELVPAVAAPGAAPAQPVFRLSGREWLLVGIGGGATLAAVIVGILLTRVL